MKRHAQLTLRAIHSHHLIFRRTRTTMQRHYTFDFRCAAADVPH